MNRSRYFLPNSLATVNRGFVRSREPECGAEGFTLIEVLIASMILVIIVSSLAGASYLALKLTSTQEAKFSESRDAQTASAWFSLDLRAASAIVTGSGTGSTCAAEPGMTSTTDLIDLTEPPISGSNYESVSYWYGKFGSSWSIIRTSGTYVSAVNPCSSPIYVQIARTLSSTVPTISCGTALTACASGTPSTSVTLSATEADNFAYSLYGVPRVSLTGEPSNTSPSFPALLALGNGADAVELGPKGSATLNVTGNIVVDSGATSAVEILGSSQITDSAGSVSYLTGATCDANKGSTPCWSGSPCSTTYISPCPISSTGTATVDPYNNADFFLPPPSSIGCSPTAPVSPCTIYTTQCSSACTSPPGFLIDTSGATTSTLYPGIYETAVNVTNSAKVVFEPGTYIFEDGISLAGAGSATSAAGGVFFYVGCSTVDTSCNDTSSGFSVSNGGAVTLSPESTGPYAGLIIFQARDDPTTLTLSGSGSATSLSGVIYAPDAKVFNEGGASLTAGSVISNSFEEKGGSSGTLNGP